MIKYYLGIDPGTKSGWAVLSPYGLLVDSGTFNLATKRDEGGGMRYLRAEREYVALLLAYGPENIVVGFEEVKNHAGNTAAHVYGGLVAILTKLCELYKVPYQSIPVGTVKKTATGKGVAPKQAMMDAAKNQWELETVEENEADAMWIAESLRRQFEHS